MHTYTPRRKRIECTATSTKDRMVVTRLGDEGDLADAADDADDAVAAANDDPGAGANEEDADDNGMLAPPCVGSLRRRHRPGLQSSYARLCLRSVARLPRHHRRRITSMSPAPGGGYKVKPFPAKSRCLKTIHECKNDSRV